jgi:hypothetical protein
MADDLKRRDLFDQLPVEGKQTPDTVGGCSEPEAAHDKVEEVEKWKKWKR